jgi:hypothetical protein
MADLSKLKSRRSGLGAPPPAEDASENLHAPEHAPAHAAPVSAPAQRMDGRTARRSNRTLQFATRVSPEFDDRIRAIAARDGLMLVEVLERALDAYESGR